jgi:membrane protein involved in colicin uptake
LAKIGSEQAKELDAQMIGSCLRDYLEEREEALCAAEEAKTAAKLARKKLKIIPGKSITAEDVAALVAAEEAEKAEKIKKAEAKKTAKAEKAKAKLAEKAKKAEAKAAEKAKKVLSINDLFARVNVFGFPCIPKGDRRHV